MEALVAVGVAGNVVQFVQGSANLVSLINDVRKNGSPSALPDLKCMTEGLMHQAVVLQSRLKACSATLQEEEQNLLEVANECENAGAIFVEYLDSLSCRQPKNVVSSVKSALKFQWSKHKLDEFVKKLDRLRNSWILSTVLALRGNNESHTDEILAHLRRLEEDKSDSLAEAASTHSYVQSLRGTIEQQTADALNTIEERIQTCLDGINACRESLLRTEGVPCEERRIVQWLNFRQKVWRYESVDPAYTATYDWIFDSTCTHSHNDFTSYLANDATEPYFINGKAGSGKSTLMKHIVRHPRTSEVLQRWAGSHELVVLHYFFWNTGTKLQKSYEGMLRSLLHAILDEHHELIPAVFPEFYGNNANSITESDLVLTELKAAFSTLTTKATYLKLAIFVDGIDELEGDHREMLRFLRSIVSPHVKLILSSRPLNVCMDMLADCPTIRLQDLTKGDMKTFVHGTHFAEHIIEKAEGVFLWVKLVVLLLVKGLQDGDDIDELNTRLLQLPSDLLDLYKKIFDKMQPGYQKDAAVIFRLIRAWNETIKDQGLPAFVLSNAIRQPSEVLTMPTQKMSHETHKWILKSTEKRISSRCCGLLELRYPPLSGLPLDLDGEIPYHMNFSVMNATIITYLHRSVAEFLAMEEVSQGIINLTQDMSLCPSHNLMSACIAALKCGELLCDHQILSVFLICAKKFCISAELDPPELLSPYVKALQEAVEELHFQSSSMSCHSCRAYEDVDGTLVHSNPEWAAFAAVHGLSKYVPLSPEEMKKEDRSLLVIYSLRSWLGSKASSPCMPDLEARCENLNYLLNHMIDLRNHVKDSILCDEAYDVCKGLLMRDRYYEALKLMSICLCASPIKQKFLGHSSLNPCLWQVVSAVSFARESKHGDAVELLHDVEDLVRIGRAQIIIGGKEKVKERNRARRQKKLRHRKAK